MFKNKKGISKQAPKLGGKKFYLQKRYVFVALGFFGMFNIYAMRVNLSVAMVAMVNQTILPTTNKSIEQLTECPNLVHHKKSTENEDFKGEQYNWNSKVQGTILGAFFYGYIVTQIPGGVMAEKLGAKWLFGCGILATSVFSLLSPLAASWSTAALIAVRVIEGLGEGVTFPAINLLISKWSPKLQRSRISTIIFSGNQIGNVIAMPVSGLLCSTDFLGGWPSVFYFFGAIGCLWFFLWSIFIYESPTHHPSISEEEKFFIELNKDKQMKSKIPWRSILTSIPVWALVVAHIGYSFGFTILFTELPTYLSNILHFDIKSNGYLSALPYIAQALSAWVASIVADKLRASGNLSITAIRKLLNCIGLFGPAVCLIIITVSGCRPELIVGLLCIGMACNGCIYSGYHVTHIDMCPEFAGTLYAITNCVANLFALFGPIIAGHFTASGETIDNWSKVFYTATATYIICGAIFALFGSAELQPWAKVNNENKTDTQYEKSINEDTSTGQ